MSLLLLFIIYYYYLLLNFSNIFIYLLLFFLCIFSGEQNNNHVSNSNQFVFSPSLFSNQPEIPVHNLGVRGKNTSVKEELISVKAEPPSKIILKINYYNYYKIIIYDNIFLSST